ncbi:lipase family protein [Okeania sp. SIO2B3]|uniref:lipase family protein n=1 Tax=Okeania sp. SIO2B3 TaxID=2607784 RepID=UPI0013C1DEB3|nr:lipase family protein [Okeania sp. SIO2B3]NET43201.1 lipase family protein [Okeania sp. SIO2B3]
MTVAPYDRNKSLLLIQAVSLAYQQYSAWKKDDHYNGQVNDLPLFKSVFNDYRVVKKLQGYSRAKSSTSIYQSNKDLDEKHSYFSYLGFILSSPTDNIIVFRGARTPFEISETLQYTEVPYLLNSANKGNIEQGVSEMYIDIPDTTKEQSLRTQINAGIKDLEHNKPWYVTGHSLGGAFAILTALELVVSHHISANNVFMYNYGGMKVGNSQFATFYNATVPNSYRVVNTKDFVPGLPPQIYKNYRHIGQEWFFCKDTDTPSDQYAVNGQTYKVYNHLHEVEHQITNQQTSQQKSIQIDPYYTAVAKRQEQLRSTTSPTVAPSA